MNLSVIAAGAPLQGGAALAEPLTLVVVLAAAGLLPFAFMSLTAFVKISTVLHIVRGAIGAPSVPSNVVILALSSALTVLAMASVGSQIAARAAPVLENKQSDSLELVTGLARAAADPLRGFLEQNASDQERGRFLELAQNARAADASLPEASPSDWTVVIPAFITTELLEAFALGFALYLPFLVIDLLVSNVLLALGMQMMNPTQVSLPFKLLLFVAVDGWGLLAQALLRGYMPG